MANARIVDYASLCSVVADWVDRTDLTAQIPDFVAFAEDRLNRTLRVPDMLVIAQAAVNNATYGNGPYFALPADWIEFHGQVKIVPALGINTKYTTLEYLAPDQINNVFQDLYTGATSGIVPRFFTVTGVGVGSGVVTGLGPSPALQIVPTPADGTVVEITYYAQLPILSDTVPTNWLLQKYPSAYLFGALLESAPYLRNDDRIEMWQAKFDSIINEIQGTGDRSRWSGGPIKGQRRSIL